VLARIVVWDPAGLEELMRAHPFVVPLGTVLATRPDPARIAARVGDIDPSGVAILVYTSGTTGPPKGAMITHENILTVLRGSRMVEFDRGEMMLSFLPMAHVAERIASFYARIDWGTATAFASSIPAVLEELGELRPTSFGSVPRIFEKAHARVQAEVQKAPPVRQKVFRWAEAVGLCMVEAWQRGETPPARLLLQWRLADRLVFRRLRGIFGGRVRRFVVGAAPTPRHVLDFFWSAGLPIYEVYGMTEATVITHGNRPGHTRLGSVGKALPYVEDRIAEDGEILLRGKGVFLGYYKDPEATAAIIDAEGWLHTGDIGRKDADGYLYIVDRKKHIIITAGGKNISPANVEGEIKGCDALISQAHVHGDRRPYCTALVTVHPLEALEWARARGLVADAAAAEAMRRALLENPLSRPPGLDALMARVTAEAEIQGRVAEAVRRANQKVARVETIKRVHLLDRDFSLEEDEITPTLKVKRKNIEKKFAAVFDKLYEDSTFGIAIESE
jgi:long-chain acyl-CoA synthetase